MVERAALRSAPSLNNLKSMCQARTAEARLAFADARCLAENSQALRSEIKLFNAPFLNTSARSEGD